MRKQPGATASTHNEYLVKKPEAAHSEWIADSEIENLDYFDSAHTLYLEKKKRDGASGPDP